MTASFQGPQQPATDVAGGTGKENQRSLGHGKSSAMSPLGVFPLQSLAGDHMHEVKQSWIFPHGRKNLNLQVATLGSNLGRLLGQVIGQVRARRHEDGQYHQPEGAFFRSSCRHLHQSRFGEFHVRQPHTLGAHLLLQVGRQTLKRLPPGWIFASVGVQDQA
jgi:hypothetical protein